MKYKNRGPPKRSEGMLQTVSFLLSNICNKFFYQTIYLFGFVCIGIMPSSLNPCQRNFRISMPSLVVPFTRTGMILRTADQ